MKDAVAHRMIEQACELYPQMADKIDFIEVGTPVTNKHYIGKNSTATQILCEIKNWPF